MILVKDEVWSIGVDEEIHVWDAKACKRVKVRVSVCCGRSYFSPHVCSVDSTWAQAPGTVARIPVGGYHLVGRRSGWHHCMERTAEAQGGVIFRGRIYLFGMSYWTGDVARRARHARSRKCDVIHIHKGA